MNTISWRAATSRRLGAALAALALATAASPSLAASAPAAAAQASAAAKKPVPAPPVKLVDINSASRKELMTLPGIGAAEADRIIANRPYLTKTELVSKAGMPIGPFLSLRDRVVARHKGPLPKAKP